jgi:hypothetical protein
LLWGFQALLQDLGFVDIPDANIALEVFSNPKAKASRYKQCPSEEIRAKVICLFEFGYQKPVIGHMN